MDQQRQKTPTELYQHAIAVMREVGAPLIPRNYELFYAHVAGGNEALNDAVHLMLSERGGFSQSAADEMYETCLDREDQGQRITECGNKLGNEADEIVRLIQEAIDTSNAFGATIEQVGRKLDDVSDPAHFKAVLKAVIEATRILGQNCFETKGRLEESRSQVQELQSSLISVRRDSLTDSLTGVANRKGFDLALDTIISEAKSSRMPLCLLMIDVDHFKKFNDTFGHPAGDQTLRLVASLIKTCVRDQDFIARYGGEEFAVILPQSTPEVGYGIAERIRKSIKGRKLVRRETGESLGSITLCVGISSLAPDDSVQSLIERADERLYLAKRVGRNRVESDFSAPASDAETSALAR